MQVNTGVQFSIPKEVHRVLHCGPSYDYQFVIKGQAEKFEGQFTYLGENTESNITFSVPIEKEFTRIRKNGEEITNTVYYRLKSIDSARFWQVHYQILLIILLKKLIKLN